MYKLNNKLRLNHFKFSANCILILFCSISFVQNIHSDLSQSISSLQDSDNLQNISSNRIFNEEESFSISLINPQNMKLLVKKEVFKKNSNNLY